MAIILEKTFPRTLDRLLADYGGGSWRGATLEAWVFEDAAARRYAEGRFAEAGVAARLYSAYKPLVHFFLEDEAARGPFTEITVAYPVDAAAPALRFLLEAYPLAAMAGDAAVRFVAAPPQTGGPHDYGVVLTAPGGAVARRAVFAPNRPVEGHTGDTALCPCGWLRVRHPDGREIDAVLQTDYERLFHEAVRAVAAHPWGAAEPFFGELNLAVSLPGGDTRLPVGEEAISLHEALHEELYFSLQELFLQKTGRAPGARDLRLGQVVPEVLRREGPPSLRIETRPLMTGDAQWPPQPEPLQEATGPLSVARIDAALASLGGEPFGVESRAGRTVPARYVRGADLPVMISGGQHANETSGVVGALRAASLLARRPGAHFAVSPLENPDGYALHARLCRDQPHHMHHAARHTALGDDLEHRDTEPLYEKAIRSECFERTRASLHISLHGYPAHEWTRPLTGYVPRGFEMWTVPKGFLLIVRHHAGWAERSRLLLARVSAALLGVPGLAAFNARQIRLCEAHAGPLPFEVLTGFPCICSEDARHVAPMTLITEFPDETIYGDAFRLAHEAHTRAVVAAYDALQEIMAPTEAPPAQR